MILNIKAIGQNSKKYGKDDEHNSHDLVLLLEIGHRTLTHIRGYLSHRRSTLILPEHPLVEIECKSQCDKGGNRHQPE